MLFWKVKDNVKERYTGFQKELRVTTLTLIRLSFLRIVFSGTGVSLTPALIIFQEELSAYLSLYPKSF